MAYNSTPQESTGVSPHRLVYGEEMLIPLDIMTDELMEPNQNVNASEYASDLKVKLKSMYDLVRGNLQKGSHRQKKQYDCRIREHTYKVGDNVWRNQWQSPPGLKATIRRHWTGPWLVVEKLCDVSFRVKHSPDSPSVVIHGDNMKHYHGDNKLNFQVLPAQETETRFPNIRDFVKEQTGEDRQLCSGESVERIPVNSESQTVLQGNDTGDNCTQLQPLQDRLSYLRSCDTQSKAYGTNKSNSTVGTDRMVEHSVSNSFTVNEQSFFNDSQVYSPRNVNTSLAEQEDLLPFRASIPDQQAEPCSSSVLTPLAEQRQCYSTARADVSKQLAEQKENHMQRFQSDSCQVPIPSQTFRQSRRVKKKPAYLGDYILLCCGEKENSFHCDTCAKCCRYKKNLVRYVKEVHSTSEDDHWICPEFRCGSHFVRRSSLTKHLMKSHGFNRLTALKKAVNAQRGNRLDHYEADLEDVRSDDSVLNLMDDIRELSNAYPMTDSNNNELDQYVKVDKVIGISDLEDISDGDLLDVDAESDEVNRSEF